MKKMIYLLLAVVATYWLVIHESVIDRLMKVEFPIEVTEASGVQYYEPERGSVVDMSDLVELGLVNIVYIYKPTCRGCKMVDKQISKLLSIRPDVAVTQVLSPGNVYYEAMSQGKTLNISYVPFVLIFDRNGKQLAANDGDKKDGNDLLYKWINAEVKRKNVQLKEEWERKQASG